MRGPYLFAACCALFLLAAPHAKAAAAEGSAPPPTCPGSLQAKIDAAEPGATVDLEPGCVYREAVTVDRPLVLDGGGEGAIRGSDVWRDWERAGGVWRSAKPVPDLSVPSNYRCEGASRRCLMPEQVSLDGRPLEQVASNPGPGRFALDADRRVLLGEDPAGRAAEVTVRERWVLGAADDVVVRGVTMKHAAGDGVWNGGHSRWTVEDNDLSLAHRKNLTLTLGDALLARENDLHDAGQMGMSSNAAEVAVVGNRIYGNNTELFDPGWAAGGVKIAQARSARVEGNAVHHNGDIGIWTDVARARQGRVEVSNNRVHHHPRAGIRVEITKNFDVAGNVLWENGWADTRNGAAITVAGSRDGTVRRNVLAWNSSGIAVVQQDRDGTEERSYDAVTGVRLLGNRVVHEESPGSPDRLAVLWNANGAAISGGAPSPYDPATGNGGASNAYWFDGPEGWSGRFRWDGQIETLEALNAAPADEDARYLSDAEKDDLLAANGAPPRPQGRPQLSLLQRVLQGLARMF